MKPYKYEVVGIDKNGINHKLELYSVQMVTPELLRVSVLINQPADQLREVEQQRDELLAALEDVVAISDRKHDAWDRAHAAIAKVKS